MQLSNKLAKLITILLISISAPAYAQSEAESEDLVWGEYEPYSVPDIETLGDDVIRFSKRPALGARGYIAHIVKREQGVSKGRIILLGGHPSEGWYETGSLHFELYEQEYQLVAKMFDDAIAKGEAEDDGSDNFIILCTDGPGYLAERVRDGRSLELKGSCGDHPNDLLAVVIQGFIARAVSYATP